MCSHVVNGVCVLQEKCHCHPQPVDLHPQDKRLIEMMQTDDPSLTVQECLTFIREADHEKNSVGYRFDVV